MLFTLAWRNLWRNRRRTLITTASIFFAVLLAIFMRSMQEGVYEKMIENVVGIYTGYVQIHDEGYWDEQTLNNSFEVIPAVQTAARADERVTALVPRLESFLLTSYQNTSQVAQIVGIDPAREDALTGLRSNVVEGRYLKADERGVLIGKGLAERLKIGIGDSLVLFGQGYRGITASELLPVVGMIKFGSDELNNRILYTPLRTAQNMFVAPDRLTAYALDLSQPDAGQEVASRIREQLPEDYEVMDWREMLPELVQSIESDRLGGYLTMGILYLIIGFGIFGTALMMTAERKYEFGVMTAIGMKKHQLSLVMVYEMILMGLLGVAAGIVIGLPVVTFFHYNPIVMTGDAAEGYAAFGIEPIIPTAIDLGIILSQGLVVMVMTAIISLYPVSKIFHIKPVEAMRV